jgi:RNA polymerase sigma-70 factor (ECF subfamily)
VTLSFDPKTDMLAAIPKLRAFAISLCGRTARADDLVQETLLRGWAHIGSFEPGTNLVAWLYTILRNEFYSEFRRLKREVPDPDGTHAATLTTRAVQEAHMEFLDFRAALAKLAADHREALILVGASGLSYEEAAQVCGCAVGTMKSRVNRARTRLAELLAEPGVPHVSAVSSQPGQHIASSPRPVAPAQTLR